MQQNKGQLWSKYIPNYAIKLGAAAPISDTSWLSFLFSNLSHTEP